MSGSPSSCFLTSHALLIQAVTAGDAETVRRLLVQGQTLDMPFLPQADRSLLGLAVASGNLEVVHLLLDAGASPLKTGAFQTAMATANQDAFRLLLARCPQALKPDFPLLGMTVHKKLRRPCSTRGQTLWQGLLSRHPAWLEELLQIRQEDRTVKPLSIAQVLTVLGDQVTLEPTLLDAFASCVKNPRILAEHVAASCLSLAFCKAGKIRSTGRFAHTIARWALSHGATLEGCRLKQPEPEYMPATALATLVAIAHPGMPALQEWIHARAFRCPLVELDTAIRSAALHLQPVAYVQLTQARARRADADAPLTPESRCYPFGLPDDRNWLRATLDRLMDHLEERPSVASASGKEVCARTFLEVFCAHPLGVSELGARPYAALLESVADDVATAHHMNTPTATLLNPVQKHALATLCLSWREAGIVPDQEESALLTSVLGEVAPEVIAQMDAYTIGLAMPSSVPASHPRLRL